MQNNNSISIFQTILQRKTKDLPQTPGIMDAVD